MKTRRLVTLNAMFAVLMTSSVSAATDESKLDGVFPAGFDIAHILGIGTIGLGFLLAFLAFRLLNREQNIEHPRDGMLKAITRFMIFSFGLCVIGLSSELYRIYRTPVATFNNPQVQLGSFTQLTAEELRPAEDAAKLFLGQLDEGQFQEAYDGLPKSVKNVVGFEDFKNQAIHFANTFGEKKDREFDSAIKGMGPAPDGYIMLYNINFRTSYANVLNAADTVTLIKSDDGAFKVVNYNKR